MFLSQASVGLCTFCLQRANHNRVGSRYYQLSGQRTKCINAQTRKSFPCAEKHALKPNKNIGLRGCAYEKEKLKGQVHETDFCFLRMRFKRKTLITVIAVFFILNCVYVEIERMWNRGASQEGIQV